MSASPKRGYVCKWCGTNAHYSYTCFKRPQKPIAAESEKHKTQRLTTRRAWFKANPPNEHGLWECYLHIAEHCPGSVTTETIDLEHVRPKGSHPKLRYEPLDIKAACQPCNKLKGPWPLEVLAETYPHIFDMITTLEWQAYEQQLTELEDRL